MSKVQGFQLLSAICLYRYGIICLHTYSTAHKNWYGELFQPCVAGGLIPAGALAGYRNDAVYLRTSRYVPPRWEAVRDAMPALFDLLEREADPGVRAVLGHWLFGYIHPYPDGNGRMARFVMNAMLASGGYPWTVIRVEDRDAYLAALDRASIDADIGPFARFIADRVQWSKEQGSEKSSGRAKGQGPTVCVGPCLSCPTIKHFEPTPGQLRTFLLLERRSINAESCPGKLCGRVRLQLSDQHRNPCDAAYDLSILRIAKGTNGHWRFGRRDEQQAASFVVAPTAGVAVVAQLNEINRTVVFARPNALDDLVLTRINLYERARPDQRIQGVVLGPDVPV